MTPEQENPDAIPAAEAGTSSLSALPTRLSALPSRRFRISVSYDGTGYHGWQVQPGLPTVQAVLQAVLSNLEGARVSVDGSGRTDSGVHALAQVAAFTLHNPIPIPNLRQALNRLLPPDIRVNEVAEVASDFHPRFHAKQKTYEYRILRTELCPPFLRNYVHHHPYRLDEAAMAELAPLLEGEHDFTAFAATDEKDEKGYSKVRRIYSSRVSREGDVLLYRVRGSGFLKHMVRNIVGVLVEVGKGNLTRPDIEARLRPRCGIPAGPSVPARGLYLMEVAY
jgi:tRNA pseudouridine38-40 synthase